MRHEYSKDWWGYMYSHPELSPAGIGIAAQMFMYCCRVSSGIQQTDNTDIVEKILGLLVQRVMTASHCCYAIYNPREMAVMVNIMQQKYIDPDEVLAQLAGANMIHTEDNIVKYYWGTLDGRKKRYIPMKQQSFRLGDIAKVQCSVVFMKSKGGSVKTKLILRALALVNCKHVMKVKWKVRFKYSDEDKEEQPTQKCWEGNEQKAMEENGGLQMED
ncbi:hypothetical protein ARMGADRAFT_1040816 [Armillaria gallica]|uniref:Uncharacterized protein n=1 Tax=Armillaria gallica TaxID=47427 RepID=A0A2H3CM15_ARMGA|nr:hypothetical protein ARMGADRAFT_1040816 [Armillaria gallica]